MIVERLSRIRHRRLLPAFALPALAALLATAPAGAATFTVTSRADDGSAGTLRYAVGQANANPGSTINFSVTGAITLNTAGAGSAAPLNVTASMTIAGPGPGSLAVSANTLSQVFVVTGGAALSVSGITIENGHGGNGAGVVVDSTSSLSLSNCVFSGNAASGNGGGIFSYGSLTISGCTFFRNYGQNYGGAIYVENNTNTTTNVTVTDSQFYSNSATYSGGLLALSSSASGRLNLSIDRSLFYINANLSQQPGTGEAMRLLGTHVVATVTNSTFSADAAEILVGQSAALALVNCTLVSGSTYDVHADNGAAVSLENTILAGAGTACTQTLGGVITSNGHNLGIDTSCGLTQAGDLQSINPLLGTLNANGGPTLTHALRACSPAINHGDNSAPHEAADQTGGTRVLFSTVDIGAVEYGTAPVPCLTAQPSGATLWAGQTLSLSVAASPYPEAPTYQWYLNDAAISGATAATYTKTAAASDSGTYKVTVSNSFGSVTSSPVAVTVNGPPVITSQPSNQTLFATQTISLSATATGVGLSYQWRKDGTAIAGATSTAYTKANAAVGDAGNYDVVVTNGAGGIPSSAAAVVVQGAPVITAQPLAETVAVGNPISLAVSASGAGLQYQWRKDGANVAGATQATFQISAAASSDGGGYDVLISNPAGSVTSNAAVVTVDACLIDADCGLPASGLTCQSNACVPGCGASAGRNSCQAGSSCDTSTPQGVCRRAHAGCGCGSGQETDALAVLVAALVLFAWRRRLAPKSARG